MKKLLVISALMLLLRGVRKRALPQVLRWVETISKYGAFVPRTLALAIIHKESRGNPRSIHGDRYGLMGLRYRDAMLMGYNGAPEGLLDPAVNIKYATAFLEYLIFEKTRRFSETIRGEGAVKRLTMGTADAALAWYDAGELLLKPDGTFENQAYVDEINELARVYAQVVGEG